MKFKINNREWEIEEHIENLTEDIKKIKPKNKKR